MRIRPAIILLMPALAHAGVTYDLTVRELPPAAEHSTQVHVVVEQDRVRAGDTIFNDGAVYVLDHAHQRVLTQPNATLQAGKALLAESIRAAQKLASQDSAATPKLDEAAVARVLEDASNAMKGPPRDLRMTERTESVGAVSCTVWEEFESGSKRAEWCIAKTSAVQGGDEVLRGIRALCGYFNGAVLVFGYPIGPPDIWPLVQSTGGIPIQTREFRNGAVVAEMTVSSVSEHEVDPTLFEVPVGYSEVRAPSSAPAPTAH